MLCCSWPSTQPQMNFINCLFPRVMQLFMMSHLILSEPWSACFRFGRLAVCLTGGQKERFTNPQKALTLAPLMKQPLGIVALFYLGGLLLGEYFQPPLPCLFAAALAIAAGTLLLARFRPYLLWPLVIFTGWTNFVWHTAIVSPMDLRVLFTEKPELVTVRGALRETPTVQIFELSGENSYYTTARLDVSAVNHGTNWHPAFGRIVI